MCQDKLTDAHKKEIEKILVEINTDTLAQLSNKDCSIKDLDHIVEKVYQFTLDKKEFVSKSLRDKVFRFLKDLHESIENVYAIHTHRTPISLKAYCEIFIYVFPLIYAPTIVYNIGSNNSSWIVYFIVLLTEFILISLYNIQNQLEYPFDNVGMDDINLDNFKIKR
jgi:predicted membrane chloride channel (bestrophin family)